MPYYKSQGVYRPLRDDEIYPVRFGVGLLRTGLRVGLETEPENRSKWITNTSVNILFILLLIS